mmetsp:Transcript_3442/g.4579  ORF Transcript_3442/g.4579 Transcript_3442/m.4579 type:complete len:540 (-) Transcript_3442:422-2041(-)
MNKNSGLPQDVDSQVSFDSSNFDSSIEGIISISPDDGGDSDDYDEYVKRSHESSNNGKEFSDDDSDIILHSIPHPDELPRAKKEKNGNKAMQTFAGVAGNVLEWYDFAVFGYFSDVIGDVFFPPQEGNAAIVESFTVFGLAFLMRPLGGLWLGYIGDKYGRKRALEISIFLMAFPTFAMGCLPSYEQVGGLAIILLTLVRMLQGLSVGGQLVSSLVFTLENNPKEKWGLYGSYVMAAANFGTLLGGISAYVIRESLDDEQLHSYGWRIPFLSGILVSLSGFYLRYYGDEETIEHHGGGGENPCCSAFRRENLRSLLAASLVPMLWGGGFYLAFVWMATFMEAIVEPPVPNAFLVNSLALLGSVCLLFPIAGILSDMFGRNRVMMIGGSSAAILSPIIVIVVSNGDPVAAFFAQTALGISLSLWGAPMCAWLVESFPPEIRLTSVAVGYNIAQAIVGGTSPAIATYLVDVYGLHSPGYIITVLAIFSLLGLYIAPQSILTPIEINSSQSKELFNYDDSDLDWDASLDRDNSKNIRETELI